MGAGVCGSFCIKSRPSNIRRLLLVIENQTLQGNELSAAPCVDRCGSLVQLNGSFHGFLSCQDAWFHGITVRTLDSESSDPSSCLNGTYQPFHFHLFCFSVSQTVMHLPTMQETRVRSLGWEDTLEKEMTTHSSTLAWKIPWMEEPGGLQFM